MIKSFLTDFSTFKFTLKRKNFDMNDWQTEILLDYPLCFAFFWLILWYIPAPNVVKKSRRISIQRMDRTTLQYLYKENFCSQHIHYLIYH